MIALTNPIARATAGALVLASVGLTSASAWAFAAPRFDGLWSVSIITDKGDCDRGYRYPIRISKGVLANAGDSSFDITGNVANTGALTVTVSHGSSQAVGIGRLAGSIGEGNWRGGECSGTWTAERRGS
jgi:hypothetical protein